MHRPSKKIWRQEFWHCWSFPWVFHYSGTLYEFVYIIPWLIFSMIIVTIWNPFKRSVVFCLPMENKNPYFHTSLLEKSNYWKYISYGYRGLLIFSIIYLFKKINLIYVEKSKYSKLSKKKFPNALNTLLNHIKNK